MSESIEQSPNSSVPRPRRAWRAKFADAIRGVCWGVREESSCRVHLLATLAVGACAALLQISRLEACVLLLCVVGVWTAELLNTSLEQLARAIDKRPDTRIANALDLASGAVLIMSLGAASIGVVILGPRSLEAVQGAIERVPIP